MRSKLFKVTLLIVVLTLMVPSVLLAAENQGSGGQGSDSDSRKYAGEWAGSVTREDGATHKLSYTLRKDEKGQWRGTVKWNNDQGEQSADFESLQIENGKMKGKFEHQGEVEATLEGQFQGDNLEGTFTVISKSSAEVLEKGTWKVTKNSEAKSGQ
jgi:hypothetical protein